MLVNIENRQQYDHLLEIMANDFKTKKVMQAALNLFLFANTRWSITFIRASVQENGEQNILIQFSQETAKGLGPVEYKIYYRPYFNERNILVRKATWEKREIHRISGTGTGIGTTLSSISIKKIRQELIDLDLKK